MFHENVCSDEVPGSKPSHNSGVTGRQRIICVAVAICLFALGCPTWIVGQTALSEIHGTVSDPSGSPAPGASVILENSATGLKSATNTNEVGLYSVLAL